MEKFLKRTLTEVKVNDTETQIKFIFDDGAEALMYHEQDCCESVYVESISGYISNLIGSPLTIASEKVSRSEDEYGNSVTATFYTFATINGFVDIRWHGSSNGYYSESVDIKWTDPKQNNGEEEC